jgi:hypothetical protein
MLVDQNREKLVLLQFPKEWVSYNVTESKYSKPNFKVHLGKGGFNTKVNLLIVSRQLELHGAESFLKS